MTRSGIGYDSHRPEAGRKLMTAGGGNMDDPEFLKQFLVMNARRAHETVVVQCHVHQRRRVNHPPRRGRRLRIPPNISAHEQHDD